MSSAVSVPVRSSAVRPHRGWSMVSTVLVGSFVLLDRLLERLGL